MKEIVAYKGQSLMDIAVQHSGDASEFCAIADANGLGYDWISEGGESLLIPPVDGKKRNKCRRYEKEGVEPCTGMGSVEMEGIGYDAIGFADIG